MSRRSFASVATAQRCGKKITASQYREDAMTESSNGGGTGHCLCGAVQYRYKGEPSTIGVCQCDRCQRQSGSAFLIGVIFPKEAVTIEGKLATYEAKADGQNRLWRHFCPNCGSAVSITQWPIMSCGTAPYQFARDTPHCSGWAYRCSKNASANRRAYKHLTM